MADEGRKGERKNKLRRRHSVGITGVDVGGYKSLLNRSELEIRPLTILAGANSSGKSSALQPLLLLKQTLEASYDPGPLKIDGPNVRFTSVDQVLSRLPGRKRAADLEIGVQVNGDYWVRTTFKKRAKKGIELVRMTFGSEGHQSAVLPSMTDEQIEAIVPEEMERVYEIFSRGESTPARWGVRRSRCFLAFCLYRGGEPNGESLFPLFSPSGYLEESIRRVVHVPGLRGNPERTYRTTAFGDEFPGTFENYIASVIHQWQSTKDDRLKELGKALETLGLTWKVEAKQVDDTQVELRVGRLLHGVRGGAKDLVSIADVGFGVSQVIPVLVALLTARPGQLVYLEQPEIHLHPRAQVALAEILADASNRGVRVVAETHSSLLLLGIQSLVAEGEFSADRTKLHWFTRDESGVTEVSSGELDDTGSYGEWPEDFHDVNLATESRFLDAAEAGLGLS